MAPEAETQTEWARIWTEVFLQLLIKEERAPESGGCVNTTGETSRGEYESEKKRVMERECVSQPVAGFRKQRLGGLEALPECAGGRLSPRGVAST